MICTMTEQELHHMLQNDLPKFPVDLENGWYISGGRLRQPEIDALVMLPYEDRKTVEWHTGHLGGGACRTVTKAMRDAEQAYVREAREALGTLGYRVVKKKG